MLGAGVQRKFRDMAMALLDETATGVYVIAATPFGDDGALDLASADRMVDFYLERGADGLLAAARVYDDVEAPAGYR